MNTKSLIPMIPVIIALAGCVTGETTKPVATGAQPSEADPQALAQLRAKAEKGDSASQFEMVTAGTITGAVQIVTRKETVLARPTIMAVEDSAVFSPDARHVAYTVGRRVQRVCLDGVEGEGYDVVTNLTFSPDGKRLAYWAVTRTHVLVVVDGKEVKAPAFASMGESPLFSPDSRHLAFGGGWGWSRGVVVLDDQVGPVYAELGELRFSPDSRRFAHMATRDDQTNVIVLDGKEIPVPDVVVEHTFTFSPDGRHFAYGLGLPPQSRMVVDGKTGPVFRGLGDCYFSPDSRRWAYEAERGSEKLVMLDGKEVVTAEEYYDSTAGFSPDSRRFAIALRRGGKGLLWVEGQELNGYDGIGSRSVVFSSDSRRLAYAAFRGKEWVVIVDGKESPGWESVDDLIFSPDSQHFAYWAKRRGEWRVVLDGAEGRAYKGASFPLLFSADSRHLATIAQRGDGTRVAVAGGAEGPAFEAIFKLVFDSPNRIRLVARRHQGALANSEFLTVELDIVTNSDTAPSN